MAAVHVTLQVSASSRVAVEYATDALVTLQDASTVAAVDLAVGQVLADGSVVDAKHVV